MIRARRHAHGETVLEEYGPNERAKAVIYDAIARDVIGIDDTR